jgi:hypothetical protein
MNKLEKVALRSTRRTGKPLVLVLNNVHLFNNDDSGKDMLLQLQQRAESWAASGEWCHSSEGANTDGIIDRYINACDELVSFPFSASTDSYRFTYARDDFWPYTVLRTSLSEETVTLFTEFLFQGRTQVA